MDEREYVPVPHAVTAMLHLAGPQPTNITIQHPGTQEATITIAVRKCVIYLCTWAAADGVGQIWRRAATDALAFPRTVGTVQPSHRHAAPTNAAEPSVVVHTYGHPAGFVRLSREPGKTAYLHVQMGGLTFFFHDKLSFESVAGAFLRAAELGAQHLPRVDLRQARPVDRHAPSLAGHAAAGRASTWRGSRSTRPTSPRHRCRSWRTGSPPRSGHCRRRSPAPAHPVTGPSAPGPPSTTPASNHLPARSYSRPRGGRSATGHPSPAASL